MNQTRERAQNGIVFVTDIICLIISYYLSGFIWLYRCKDNVELMLIKGCR